MQSLCMESTVLWDVMLCSSISTTSSEDCAVYMTDPRRLYFISLCFLMWVFPIKMYMCRIYNFACRLREILEPKGQYLTGSQRKLHLELHDWYPPLGISRVSNQEEWDGQCVLCMKWKGKLQIDSLLIFCWILWGKMTEFFCQWIEFALYWPLLLTTHRRSENIYWDWRGNILSFFKLNCAYMAHSSNHILFYPAKFYTEVLQQNANVYHNGEKIRIKNHHQRFLWHNGESRA
jgi:hypothetical protein